LGLIPRSQISTAEEDERSEDSDRSASTSPQDLRNDLEWTPGSSYLRRKLQESNTADDIAYRLRSRIVSRSEQETEADKEQAEPDGMAGNEQSEESTRLNTSPSENTATSPYNLRSKVGFAPNAAQQ
jgi:hypothetical protein